MEQNNIKSYLIDYYGKPDYHFTRKVANEKGAYEILIYLPIPNEGILHSMLITLGFSSPTTGTKDSPFEYVVELKDDLNAKEFEELSEELLLQLSNKPLNFPGIESPIKLSNYPHFKSFIVLNYGKHDSYYWETEPEIRAYEIIPIYQEEMDAIAKQPKEIINALFFRSSNTDWVNWNRPGTNIIQEAVSGTWTFITDWYKKNTQKLFNQLKKGASKNDIDTLEKALGNNLPEDFIYSLQEYNGKVDFHDYKYLSTDEILETWKLMNDLLTNKKFPNRAFEKVVGENLHIQNVWWHEKWIPFGKDSGGNLMCLDMAPSDSGTKGQIIYWEKTEGPVGTKYKSFFHWLFAYEQSIYKGYYKINEEGNLI